MSEPFTEWIKTANRITHELRLIVKNGIQYHVKLTDLKKPKKRKFKGFNAKKWQIKNLFLVDWQIVAKMEIEKIIKDNPTEQEKYDKAFLISKRETYNLLLSDKQYKTLTQFLKTEKIQLNQEFYIQRKGIGLKTYYAFSLVK